MVMKAEWYEGNAMVTIDSVVYQDELSLPCSNKLKPSPKMSYRCLVAINSSHQGNIEEQME